jgi:transposase
MEQAIVYIGIDVAKAHLDVSWAATLRRFPNEPTGHATLVRWLKTSATPVQLICEASGGYEQALLESLASNQLAVTLVQAVRVRQYARAAGILAKTDQIDARVLAAFGTALRPKPTPPRSAETKALTRTGVPAPTLEQNLKRGRKSPGATKLQATARTRAQLDQQNQKANRRDRKTHRQFDHAGSNVVH